MPETYTIPVECTNCYKGGHVEIPKGTPVSQVAECPNCGCMTATPCDDRKQRSRPEWDLPKGAPKWGEWHMPHLVTDINNNPFPFPPQIHGHIGNQQ